MLTTGKKYSKEFKLDAVSLVADQGYRYAGQQTRGWCASGHTCMDQGQR